MPTLPCISTSTQPLAATRVAVSGCKWPLQASGRKWPLPASGRKWPQVAAPSEWPQVAAPSEWPQVATSGRSKRVAASGRKWPLPASVRKWPQVAAPSEWPQVDAPSEWPQVAAFGDFNFHTQSNLPAFLAHRLSSIDRTSCDKFENFVSTRAQIAKPVFFAEESFVPAKGYKHICLASPTKK